MRLIDADAVKEALRNRISENIDECINNVPTVDVFEQIRAEIDKQAWSIAISDTDRANGMWDAYRIIDKYTK